VQRADRRCVVRHQLAQHVDLALDHAALLIDDAPRGGGFQRASIAIEQFDA
jgi:hypothetical protein